MECNQFKSVVSLVDSVVHSAHARRSRTLLPSLSIRAPSMAPISRKSPTDFSICSILALETDATQSSPSPECHSNTNTQISPYSDCTSPCHSHRDTSPPLTPYSDCESDPDQIPTHSEQAKKKRQRTTFSPIEVWEMERAFRRRPYLVGHDEEELVQKLGITAKSVKCWFQNRRAKARKLERKMTPVYQTSPSNQFVLPVSRASHTTPLVHFVGQSPLDQWKKGERQPCPAVDDRLEYQPYSKPTAPVSHHLSVKSNKLRGHHSFPLTMFHPDQFKIRPAEPARELYRSASNRFRPY